MVLRKPGRLMLTQSLIPSPTPPSPSGSELGRWGGPGQDGAGETLVKAKGFYPANWGLPCSQRGTHSSHPPEQCPKAHGHLYRPLRWDLPGVLYSPPALETTCPCYLPPPCPLGQSLCLWGGSCPGKVGCFLKAALLAGLGLWLSSLPPVFTF